MHIDFCFIDHVGRLLVAGWSPEADLALRLMAGGQRLSVTTLSRFPRRDLGSRQEHGMMASFRLRGPFLQDGKLPDMAIIANGEVKELPSERFAQDEERLITSGVDELFAAYLRAIAAGTYGRPGRDKTRLILNRIQGNLRALPAETPAIAVNLDRLLVAPSGLGVFTGWCMTDRARPSPLAALVSGGPLLNPATIILNSMKREDLAAYRDRYRYTGTNGFCGAFRLPVAADGGARMVLLGNVAMSDFVFGREAELVSDEEAAVALTELRSSLSDPSHALALTAAAAPRYAPTPFSAPPAGACDDVLSVALEVDVEPVELRDVLRIIHAAIGRRFTLHLLGRGGGDMSRQVAAALAEARGEVTLGATLTAAQLPTHDFGSGRLIYGRASAFFQLPLPALDDATSARVLYHDPIASLPGSQAELGWRGKRNPPFLLAAPAALLAAGFSAGPRGFLTPEGAMRAVVDLLDEHGVVRAERAGGPTWYPGTDTQSHPEYGIARAVDAEMRALVAHEEQT